MQNINEFISNHAILIGIWIIFLILVIKTYIYELLYKVKKINCAEAISLINKENSIVIDVRSPELYCIGHIVGSLNIPILNIKNNNFHYLKKYKKSYIIIVCTTDNISTKAAVELIKIGFTKILVLQNGLKNWSENNLPLIASK